MTSINRFNASNSQIKFNKGGDNPSKKEVKSKAIQGNGPQKNSEDKRVLDDANLYGVEISGLGSRESDSAELSHNRDVRHSNIPTFSKNY